MRQHGLIICAGLYSSGSTWVFNAAAEIERLNPPGLKVASLYRDKLDEKLEREAADADCIVLKTHLPDAAMRIVAARTGAPVILSVRDPLDCVASLMQRFNLRFAKAAGMVGKSCAAILRLIPACQPLILKYEDRFTAGSHGIDKIAAYLGRTLPDEALRALAEKLSSENVVAFIAGLASEGFFDDRPFASQWHGPTQWHPNHVGDGVAGKYAKVLTPPQIATVRRRTSAFRTQFGYKRRRRRETT